MTEREKIELQREAYARGLAANDGWRHTFGVCDVCDAHRHDRAKEVYPMPQEPRIYKGSNGYFYRIVDGETQARYDAPGEMWDKCMLSGDDLKALGELAANPMQDAE